MSVALFPVEFGNLQLAALQICRKALVALGGNSRENGQPGTDAFCRLLRTGVSLERFVHDSRSRLIEHNRDDESNHTHGGRVNHESIAVGERRPFRCAEI